MPNLRQQISDYVRQTLGVSVHTATWEGVDRLPAFLTARYRFVLMVLQGVELLLMVDEGDESESPAIVRKHAEQIRAKWSGPIVYVREWVTAYNRKRLIEQRLPFIVPGNQMYLPELGLDLREYFRAPHPQARGLRPATQAVLTFVLLNQDQTRTTASELASVLGYSTMTLSRAFDELESAELANTETSSRARVLRLLGSRRQTWERAQPWLIDPVKSRHFVTRNLTGLHSGQDALARYSMLSEPRLPTIAIGHTQWASFAREHPDSEVPDRDAATCEVEVWKYEPRAHDQPGVVDLLSLYLSLRHESDERVEQARDALLEHLRW